MKTTTYQTNPETDFNMMGMTIANEMLAHAKCSDIDSKGFYFDFGGDESCSYKRKCPGFFNAATEFVRYAKTQKMNIQMFMDLNQQISLKLTVISF